MWADSVKGDFLEELGLGLGFAEGQDLECRHSRWGKLPSSRMEANLVGRSRTGLSREQNRGSSNRKIWVELPLECILPKQRAGNFSLIQSGLSKRICGLQSYHFCHYSLENLGEWYVPTCGVISLLSLWHSEECTAEAHPRSPSGHPQAHRRHAQEAFCWATASIRHWATWGRNWKWAKQLRWVWSFNWK